MESHTGTMRKINADLPCSNAVVRKHIHVMTKYITTVQRIIQSFVFDHVFLGAIKRQVSQRVIMSGSLMMFE